eukprot:gene6430-3059_t
MLTPMNARGLATCSATFVRHAFFASSSMTRSMSSNPYPPPDASRGGAHKKLVAKPLDIIENPTFLGMTKRDVQICQPIFKDFGGMIKFSGMIETVKCFENNPLVRKTLEEPGMGRVLVVDGGASMRCALLGDQIAEMATENGWSGIVINGCIRGK